MKKLRGIAAVFLIGILAISQSVSVAYASILDVESSTDYASVVNSATYGNGNIIAVGDGGYIAVSADGNNWTAQTSNTTNKLNDVVFGNGLYVAVGAAGTVVESTDGTTWNSVVSNVSDDIEGITYGNGTFVAVGDNGLTLKSADGSSWSATYVNESVETFLETGSVQTFTAPATGTYTFRTWGAQGNKTDVSGVGGRGAYAEGKYKLTEGQTAYVYVGGQDGYNGGGIGGQAGNSGANGGGATDIRVGSTSLSYRVIVAGGGGGGGGSANGTSNSNTTALLGSSGGYSAVAGNEVAVAEYGKGGKPGTSTAGGAGGAGGKYESIKGKSLGTMKVGGGGGGGGGYYGGGGGGSGYMDMGASVSNGLTGTTGSLGTGGAGAKVNYSTANGHDAFTGGGGGGGSSYIGKVSSGIIIDGASKMTLVDGSVTCGNTGDGAATISLAGAKLNSVEYINGKFIAVGYAGNIYDSTDGITWNHQDTVTVNTLNCVKNIENTVFAVGDNGTILNSTDGISWNTLNSNTSSTLYGVEYFNGAYAAVGDAGTITATRDLIEWSVQKTDVSTCINDIITYNSELIAVGSSCIKLKSSDVTPPDITVQESIETPTTKAILITVSASDDDSGVASVKWASGERTADYFDDNGTEYTEAIEVDNNGTYTIYSRDNVGNSIVKVINVTNIDREAPVISASQEFSDDRQKSMVISVTKSESCVTKYSESYETAESGTEFSTSFVVSKNGTYYIYAVDEAGNSAVSPVKVSGIRDGQAESNTIINIGDNVIPISVDADPVVFRAVVPVSLPVSVANDGSVLTANNASVTNNSSYGYIRVDNIKLEPIGDWSIKDSNLDFSNMNVNTKAFSFELNDKVPDASSGQINLSELPVLGLNKSIALEYGVKIPPQANGLDKENIANIVITVGWYK